MTLLRYWLLAICISPIPFLFADQVIMKDGTVYKGKIQLDTEKAVLIGNPPFDPTAYMLETKDIDKIIYEEYVPNSPAERKRGVMLLTRLQGDVFSSDQLPTKPAALFGFEGGFRIHPFFELNGGLDWAPEMRAKNGLLISDTQTPPNVRQYESFRRLRGTVGGRIYPFFEKKWKPEPYLTAGYLWGKLMPAGSGDKLTGSGWWVGPGVIYPLNKHWYLDGRLVYESMTYDKIYFIGQEGTLNPSIHQKAYSTGIGISYRL